MDPALAKSEERDAQLIDATITFELVARDWLAKTASERAATTTKKKSLAGQKPAPANWQYANLRDQATRRPLDRPESAGSRIESAHRVKHVCGQILRFAVASGLAERDMTADLRGALATSVTEHYASINTSVLLIDGFINSAAVHSSECNSEDGLWSVQN